MIEPGTLRDRITIQHFTPVKDDWGQVTEAWADLTKVWANVRFLNGKEFISADREMQEATASIRIRRRAVTTAMRIVFDGVIYDITAVLPGPKREYIDLAVKTSQSKA